MSQAAGMGENKQVLDRQALAGQALDKPVLDTRVLDTRVLVGPGLAGREVTARARKLEQADNSAGPAPEGHTRAAAE